MTTYLGFLGACLCISALLVGLATLRIRGVVLKQAGQPGGEPAQAGSLSVLSHSVMVAVTCRAPRSTATRSCGVSGTGRSHRACLRVVWLLVRGPGLLWIVLSLQGCGASRRRIRK